MGGVFQIPFIMRVLFNIHMKPKSVRVLPQKEIDKINPREVPVRIKRKLGGNVYLLLEE